MVLFINKLRRHRAERILLQGPLPRAMAAAQSPSGWQSWTPGPLIGGHVPSPQLSGPTSSRGLCSQFRTWPWVAFSGGVLWVHNTQYGTRCTSPGLRTEATVMAEGGFLACLSFEGSHARFPCPRAGPSSTQHPEAPGGQPCG